MMRVGNTLLIVICSWSSTPAADIKPFISEETSPIEVITAKDKYGYETTAVVRKPPGRTGPMPAIVFFHGGLDAWPLERLKATAKDEPLHAMYLAGGYVMVQSTYRSRSDDPQRPETVWSAVAMIDRVKKLPGVDPRSVVATGSSGGGTLAMELAAETDLAAIGVHEPGSIIFTGMLNTTNRSGGAITADPTRYWTPEIQQRTRERLRRLHCPVFVSHGDVHPLKKLNFEIFLPELLKSGKPVQIHVYPGMEHSLMFWYHPNRVDYLQDFFEDSDRFFRRYLGVQPVPIDRAYVQRVPDTARKK